MTKIGQLTVGSLMGRLSGAGRRREVAETSFATAGLEPLTERLSRHKVTRIALSFLDANAGLHLKDLLLDAATDDRLQGAFTINGLGRK